MILADITLFQCDECSAIICLRNDEEWARFVRDWHGGIEFQFCPACRLKVETLVRRTKDNWRAEKTLQVVMETIN